MDADAQLERLARGRARYRRQLAHRLHEPKPRADCALGIVLVRYRIAEDRQRTVPL